MDLSTVITQIEPSEIFSYLDIEDIINIYLTSKKLRYSLETIVLSLYKLYQLTPKKLSFSSFISTVDRELLTKRTYKRIGVHMTLERASTLGRVDIFTSFEITDACTYSVCALNAARNGHVEIFDSVLRYSNVYFRVNNTGECIKEAARSGHLCILEYAISHRICSMCGYGRALTAAAECGQLEMVKAIYPSLHNMNMLVELPIAVEKAAGNGHIEVVRFFLTRGKVNTTNCMVAAAQGGHLNIIKLFLSERQPSIISYREPIVRVAQHGRLEVMTLLLSYNKDITVYNEAMRRASESGNVKIVKYLIQSGHVDWYSECFLGACSNGHLDIIISMLPLSGQSISDYNSGMIRASIEGHTSIVELMIALGANNFEICIKKAQEFNHDKVVTILREAMLSI